MTRHGLVPLLKRARRYSSYKGELTKAPDNLVNRVFHAEEPNRLWVTDLTEFSIPAGKVYLSPVIDCYDGDAGGLDDRHEPERRAGQPDAPRRVRHARGRGASGHPLRPRLPLPVARMDPHPQREQAHPVDGREGLQSGQRGRGRVLRASQAGVLPRPELHGRHHRRVRRTVGRVHALVSGTSGSSSPSAPASPNEDASSDSWHNQRTRTPESNKTSPPPNLNKQLNKNNIHAEVGPRVSLGMLPRAGEELAFHPLQY